VALELVAVLMGSSGERLDVVVVGAGPAGGTAATLLARRGLRVLLVEKEALPRPKVCGGCLGAGGVRLLERAGLGSLPALSRSPRMERFELWARGRRLVVPTPGGRMVFREDLDLELAIAARSAGAELLDGTRAKVGRWNGRGRVVELNGRGPRTRVEAAVVLAAGGLVGALAVEDASLRPVIHRRSRIGVGAVLPMENGAARTVTMAVGREGYVGFAPLGNGRTAVAAAVNRSRMRRHGGVPETLRALWNEAAVPALPGIDSVRWAGTPPLTRAVARPAGEGMFLIGDAAAYEEPFTGEGMTWAIASALAVAPLAAEGVRRWRPELVGRWTARHRRLLGWRRWRCRLLAQLVRSPGLVALAGCMLRTAPGLSSSLASSLTGSPRVPEAGP